jgi:MFS family permease
MAAPQPERRSLPFLLVIGLFGIGLGFTINILDPFLYTEKTRSLAHPALKNTVLGFITIMSLLVALVVQPLVGRWSDRTRSRWGRRPPFLTAGAVGLSFSLFLIVVADELWLLVIGAMLAAASSNTTQGAWQALIPDRVPEAQHGRAAGIKTLLEVIGAVAGLAVIGTALARGSIWVGPLVASILFFVILFITLSALGPEEASRHRQGDVPDDTDERPSANALFLTRRGLANPAVAALRRIGRGLARLPTAFIWWTLNRVLFWSSAIALRTFLLNYLEDVLSLSLADAQVFSSRLLLILGGGIVLLAIPAGVLADRIGRRPLLVTAGLLAASGTLLLLFLRDINLLFVAGALIATGAGIFASTSWALATDLAPGSGGALYLGLANSATVIGSISGRLGGPLIDGVNFVSGTATLGYLVVFSIAALFFTMSSVAVLRISERRP